MRYNIEEIIEMAQETKKYKEFDNVSNALESLEHLITEKYGREAYLEIDHLVSCLMGECEVQGFYNGYTTAIQLVFNAQPPQRREYE